MTTKRIIYLLLALLVGCLAAAFYFFRLSESLDMGALNYWFRFRGVRSPPAEVVIVAMDEVSYRDLDVPLNQPWPRALHGQLLTRLAELGAKRAVFDVLFLDAGADPKADAVLAKGIAALPTFLGVESATQFVAGSSGTFALEEIMEPYGLFAKAAAGMGLVGLPEDSGAVRRFLTERSEQTAAYPSLAEAGAGLKPEDGAVRPTERDLINFFGPARTIKTFSYYQVLQQERPISADYFKDKVVYIGLALRTETGPAQKDIYRTSYGGMSIFGMEVHATAAANLIHHDWIRRLAPGTELILQVILAAGASFLIMTFGPMAGGFLTLGVLVAWALASYVAFLSGVFVPGALVVLLLIPAVYLVSTLFYYFVEQRSARQMKSAFEHYLSPEMVRQLSQGDTASALGGAKIWATALFTDIQDFTKITEEMPAERVAEMLNAYFTEVMEVIFHHQGTLIKFIGDAAFVLWGAPVRIDNHAELALRSAINLHKEVEKFNRSGRFPALITRIGLNTGPMVVGNLGSKRRFDYTAIGDAVNLASRIESLNKVFGTTILFTETTRKDAGRSMPTYNVGEVKVAGKSERVMLYTTFDPPLAAPAESTLESALQQFRKRNWNEVKQSFAELAARDERLAGVAKFYGNLVDNYLKSPPPEGWSGELSFDHK